MTSPTSSRESGVAVSEARPTYLLAPPLVWLAPALPAQILSAGAGRRSGVCLQDGDRWQDPQNSAIF